MLTIENEVCSIYSQFTATLKTIMLHNGLQRKIVSRIN